MGWPVVGNFNASVQGPLINPSVVEAGGAGEPVAPHQPPEQVRQHEMQAQQPAQQLAPHAAFVDKLFAEAAKIADAGQQKSLFNAIGKDTKGLDKATRMAIDEGCANVKKSLAELDKLTGRQIAEYGKTGNENIKRTLWDALQAHMNLADMLMAASNEKRLKPKNVQSFQRQAILLNKRVCTITKLIGELDAAEPDAEALGRTHQTAQLGKIAERNSDAGRELRVKLGEITRQVDDLSVLKKLASDQETSDSEIAEAKMFLKDLSRQLDGIAGKTADPSAANLVAAARDVVKRAGERLAKTDLAQIAKKAAGEMVKLLVVPGADVLRSLSTHNMMREYGNSLNTLFKRHESCVKQVEDLRKLAVKVVNGKAAAKELDGGCRSLCQALDAFESYLVCFRVRNNDSEGKKLLAYVWQEFKSYGAIKYRIQEAIEHLKQLVDQKTKLDGYVLKRVLDDHEAFSAVVEARVRGIDPSLVDFDLSTENLKKKEVLGSGGYSLAFKCMFKRKDGTDDVRVFKPDGVATRGLSEASVNLFCGMADGQKAIYNNFMAHEVAEMVGAGHTVCKSSAGFVNGQFGFLMEEAPGISSDKMADAVLENKLETKVGEMKIADYLKLPIEPTSEQAVAKTLILAQMAQQLNQLQWADLIAGQLDRHCANYNVGISLDGKVTIKGFDNDMCGAAHMVGIGKVKITNIQHFQELLAYQIANGEYPGDTDIATAASRTDELVKSDAVDDEGVVDVSRITSAERLSTLIGGTGLRSIAPPTYMDKGVYDNLLDLTNGVKENNGRYEGGKLASFREALLKRGLTDEQVEAAVVRLMEARDIGIRLDGEHKVYTLDQLENMETLKTIVNNERQRQLNSTTQDDTLKEEVQNFGTNYFNRSEFVALIPEEWKNGAMS